MTVILENSETTATLKHMQSITPIEEIAEAKKWLDLRKNKRILVLSLATQALVFILWLDQKENSRPQPMGCP